MDLVALDGNATEGPDLSVMIVDPDSPPCWLEFRNGRIEVKLAGKGHDLSLRSTTIPVSTWLTASHGHALDAEPLLVAGQDCDYRPIFPIDVKGPCEVVDLVPFADAVVQQIVSGSPIGSIHYVDTFTDGVLARRRAGIHSDPDVTVWKSFSQSVRSLEPGLTLIERIEGNRVHGRDSASLMIVAGLYDNDAFRAWLGHRSEVNGLLLKLSLHRSALLSESES